MPLENETRLEWIVTGLKDIQKMSKALLQLSSSQTAAGKSVTRLNSATKALNQYLGVVTKINKAADGGLNLVGGSGRQGGGIQGQVDSAKQLLGITKKIAEVNKSGNLLAGSGRHGGGIASAGKLGADGLIKYESAAKKAVAATNRLGISIKGVIQAAAGFTLHRIFARITTSINSSITAAIEFQQRIGEIRTISQKSQLPFKQWAGSVRKLSDEFNIPSLQAAEGVYQALSNQIEEGAESFQFAAEAARLAKSTNSEYGIAVAALSGTLNAFGLTSGSASHATDVLIKTVELGRTRLSELGNSLGSVQILGGQLGATMEEVSAAVDVMSIKGLTSAKAQTLLRNVLLKMIRPTEALQKVFDKLGTGTGKNTIETFGFVGALEQIRRVAREGGEEMSELGKIFGRVRAVTGVLATDTDDLTEALAEMENATETASKAFELIRENAGEKLSSEFNKIRNFFVHDLGDAFVESLAKFSDSVGGLADAMKELATATVKIASILTATLIGRSIIKNVDKLILSVTKSGGAMAALTGTAATLKGVIAGLAKAIGKAAVVITAFVAGFEAVRRIGLSFQLAADGARELETSIFDVAQALSQELIDASDTSTAAQLQNIAEVERTMLNTLRIQNRAFKQSAALRQGDLNRLIEISELLEGFDELERGIRLSNARENPKATANILRKQAKDINKEIFLEIEKGVDKDIEKIFELGEALARVAGQTRSTLDGGIFKGQFPDRVRAFEPGIQPRLSDDPQRRRDQQLRFNNSERKREEAHQRKLNDRQANFNEVDAKRQLSNFKKGLSRGVFSEINKGLGAVFAERNTLVTEQSKLNTRLTETAALQAESAKFGEANELAAKNTAALTKNFGDTLKDAKIQAQGLLSALIAFETKTANVVLTPTTANIPTHLGSVDISASLTEQERIQNEAFNAIQLGIEASARAGTALTKLVNDEKLTAEGQLQLLRDLKTIRQIMIAESAALGPTNALENDILVAAEMLRQGIAPLESSIFKLSSIETFLDKIKTDIKEGAESELEVVNQIRDAYELSRINSVGLDRDEAVSVGTLAGKFGDLGREIQAAANARINLNNARAGSINRENQTAGNFFGGQAARFANGGSVGSDTVDAKLSVGETVMNKRISRELFPQLTALNSGAARFNEGGNVTNNNVGDVNVSVNGGDTSEATVREIGNKLRRELSRGTLRLN